MVDITNKKPENAEKEEKVESKKDFPYDVKLCDIWGSSSKDVAIIPVQRAIEGNNTYLYNEKFGFKEVEPKDSDEFRAYKIEELEEEIKKQEMLLKSSNDINKKDIRGKIKQYSNWLNSLKLQGKGSYMRFSQTGKPYFEFDRVGNFRMPVFKNVDKSLLYTPSETKIKKGGDLIKENNDKNGDPNKQLKLLNIFITIVLVILAGIFIYATYKTSELPDQCSVNLDKASAFFVTASERIDNAADTLNNITGKVYIKEPDVEVVPSSQVVN